MRERIESYLDRLYGFAVALTQEQDSARDLVQDCVVRALDSSRVPSDEPAYRAWLFRIMRNAFIDKCRRAGIEVPLEPGHEESEADTDSWCGDRRIVDVLTVRFAIAKLAPVHREIIGLVDFSGLSYQEAAEVLGVAPGTIMSRVSRARRALLVVMEQDNVIPIATARAQRR